MNRLNRVVIQITLTSQDITRKFVDSYESVKNGYKSREDHWVFLEAVRF